MGCENLSVILQSSIPVSKDAVKLLYTENSTWLGQSRIHSSTVNMITRREYISLITEGSLWPGMSQHANCRSVPSSNTVGDCSPRRQTVEVQEGVSPSIYKGAGRCQGHQESKQRLTHADPYCYFHPRQGFYQCKQPRLIAPHLQHHRVNWKTRCTVYR